MNTLLAFVIVLLAAAALPHPASAQYFGRNKVQYEQFDFKVLSTEHFDIYYYPEEEASGTARRAHGRALVRAPVDAAAP